MILLSRIDTALWRLKERLGLWLLRRNGWEASRCSSCSDTGCILLMDLEGFPDRCPFEPDNDGHCFGSGR